MKQIVGFMWKEKKCVKLPNRAVKRVFRERHAILWKPKYTLTLVHSVMGYKDISKQFNSTVRKTIQGSCQIFVFVGMYFPAKSTQS